MTKQASIKGNARLVLTGTGHPSPLLVGRENGRLEENPVEGVKSLILRRLLRNLLGFFNSGNRSRFLDPHCSDPANSYRAMG